MRVSEIARVLGLEFTGDDVDILSLNSLNRAKNGELSFVESRRYLEELKKSEASAIFVSDEFLEYAPKDCTKIITQTPHLSLAKISKEFAKPILSSGSEPIVGSDSTIMENVHIGCDTKIGFRSTIMSGAFIGERVEIGDDTIIYPNTTIYNDTIIGNSVILQAGVVVGGDGFGYVNDENGVFHKIYHNGNVVIEDFVEIGANSTVDRAVFASTIIKRGTKIDNQVMVAHNCTIGENCIIVAQSGVSGSSTLGRGVIVGGQVGIAGHLEIGDFAKIGAKSGVNSSIKGSKTYAGFPLMEHREWLRLHSKLLKLLKKG